MSTTIRTSRWDLLCVFLVILLPRAAFGDDRPNVLWIIVEDMSTPFGCYGEKDITTPNVDRLAADGVRFTSAFVTAPVCSAARSALITGMYQTSIGAHHHRSGRGAAKIHLPKHVKLVPRLFKEAGYWTCNLSKARMARSAKARNRRARGLGKTDYNFVWDKESTYDGNDWTERGEEQPFFAQIQLRGGKGRTERSPRPVDWQKVTLPPYYPRDPVILKDWAHYLNAAINTDEEVGRIVKRLKDEGIYDNTYIFFITDHGISHARGKQFLYEEGIRIPFVVTGPGIQRGTVRDDLIIHIDMAATSLALAGIAVPDYMESRDILAKDYVKRQWIVSARDRCDETVERLRCVRTDRYKYIRNGFPERPYLQPNRYKDNKPIIQAMRRLHREGKLNSDQALIMRTQRPEEELYDLESDPYELRNLAGAGEHEKLLAGLRRKLDHWIEKTGDQGQRAEPAEMYDSDMAVYRQAGGKGSDRARQLEQNIAQMKRWAAEGK